MMEAPLGVREYFSTCPPTEQEGSWPGQETVEYAIRIAPGGSFVQNWDGLYSLVRSLPASCGNDRAGETCLQRLRPVAGEEIRFDAVSAVVCLANGGADCNCDIDAQGSCIINGAGPEGAATHSASLTVLDSPPDGGYVAELAPR